MGVARPSVDLKAYFKDRDCEEHKRGYWLSGDAEALGGQCKLWTPGLSDDLPEVRCNETSLFDGNIVFQPLCVKTLDIEERNRNLLRKLANIFVSNISSLCVNYV